MRIQIILFLLFCLSSFSVNAAQKTGGEKDDSVEQSLAALMVNQSLNGIRDAVESNSRDIRRLSRKWEDQREQLVSQQEQLDNINKVLNSIKALARWAWSLVVLIAGMLMKYFFTERPNQMRLKRIEDTLKTK